MSDADYMKASAEYQNGWRDAVAAMEDKVDPPTGEWVHDGPRFKGGNDWMHCSSCYWSDLWVDGTRTPHCPICGAKMSNPSEAMKDRIATVRVMPARK